MVVRQIPLVPEAVVAPGAAASTVSTAIVPASEVVRDLMAERVIACGARLPGDRKHATPAWAKVGEAAECGT